MKFDDAFYRGFRNEFEELQKEGWVQAALALAPAALKIGKGVVKSVAGAAKTGARAGARGVSTAGKGLWGKAKSVAGRAAGYVPFMGGGGSNKGPGQGSSYVR